MGVDTDLTAFVSLVTIQGRRHLSSPQVKMGQHGAEGNTEVVCVCACACTLARKLNPPSQTDPVTSPRLSP